MFENLHLTNFGRFADLDIELDRTTWVMGGNESGKTTVFDAMVSCLSPEGPSPRYGEAAVARLGQGEALANNQDLWLLHAVPEGSSELRGEGDTAAAIDARLRAALVGVRAVANQLAATASNAEDSPHNLDLRRLRDNLDALAEQWQQTWNRRCELLANHAETTRLDQEIADLDAQLAHQQERAHLLGAQIEDEAARGRMSAQRAQIELRLQRLAAHRADGEALEELAEISDAGLATIDALQEDLTAHLDQIETIKARQVDGRRRLGDIASEIDEARAQLPQTKRAAERATATRLRLERFLDQPKQIERQVWHGGRVVAALVFFAAGMLSAAFLGGTVHFLGLGLGMTLGTCTLAWGRQTVREEDGAGEATFIGQLCEEWNREASLPTLSATVPAQVITFCDERIGAYQHLTTTLDQHVTYKTRVEEELAHILDRSHDMLITTLPPRRAAVDAWLHDNDSPGRDDYAERLLRRKRIEARMVERTRTGDMPHDLEEITTLEATLESELETLAHQDIDGQHKSDTEMEDLTKEHHQVDSLHAQLAAQRQELINRREAIEVSEPRDLATVLHQIEQEQQRVETTVAEIEADKRTAASAHELVAQLANAPDLHWQLLNETLAALLESAGLGGWQVTIDGLHEDNVRLVDPRGHERTLATLGSGAHDLMVLACRLAFAAELDGDALPFLVLEEPFARLDDSHTHAAAELLRAFGERSHWQLVIISRNQPPPSLSDARVVDLDAIA